jgi:hypothetical protein
MLQFIESPDDVIAIEVSDKITGSDLDTIMSRLDEVMAKHDKGHVFVETRSINGIEIAGLPSYMARAMPLFGKLDRFGRVAVVADQTWVRVGTRLESAILPNISYRTYMPEERAEALAWVTGSPRL